LIGGKTKVWSKVGGKDERWERDLGKNEVWSKVGGKDERWERDLGKNEVWSVQKIEKGSTIVRGIGPTDVASMGLAEGFPEPGPVGLHWRV
jgi:hypothetical protein